MNDFLKKYGLYFVIWLIGVLLNNYIVSLKPGINNYNLGFLFGGIAVIPLWSNISTKYRK